MAMIDIHVKILRYQPGKNDKAVRQLELTYGGGKTHALIALLHAARGMEGVTNLAAAIDAGADILAGKVRGRLVVNVNA